MRITFTYPAQEQQIGKEEIISSKSNLLSYYYNCWINQVGCCLRPDMIWLTVLNEVKDELDLQKPDLLKLLKETRFSSDSFDLESASLQVISSSDEIFINEIQASEIRSCGIPFMEFGGSSRDWRYLHRRLIGLHSYVNSSDNKKLIDNSMNTVCNIIYSAHNIRMPCMTSIDTAGPFFQNVFYLSQQDGRDIVGGWVTNFFKPENVCIHKRLGEDRLYYEICGKERNQYIIPVYKFDMTA